MIKKLPKHSALFIATLFVVAGTANAQSTGSATPPPPPPAAKYTIKGDPISFRHESTEGGYRITFPAKPTNSVVPINAAFGKTTSTVDSLATSLAAYSVMYMDFPTVITDKLDLNTRFDQMRDGQEKRMAGRTMVDSEFYFGEHFGRETVIENDQTTLSMRVLIVGPRMFMIAVVTRGKLSTQSEILKKANSVRIQKFFESFEITKVVESKTKQVELPSDFGVSITNGKLSSMFFGLSVDMPVGWYVMNSEESAEYFELGKESMRRNHKQFADAISNENTRVLAMATNSTPEKAVSSASFAVLAERAVFPNFLPTAVAQSFKKVFLDKNETVVKDVTTTTISGVEFAWLEMLDNDTKLQKRIYFANRQGICFEIVFVYKDKADVAVLEQAFNTIRFSR